MVATEAALRERVRVRPEAQPERRLGGDLTGRRASLLAMLAVAATVTAASLVLLLQDPRYFYYGDTQAGSSGVWFHLGQEIRNGNWPLLDLTSWRAGNFVAEGQWGLFSPLIIGLALAAGATPDVLLFATLVKLTFVVVGAVGVFALARSYAVPRGWAYIAGITVPMGGMTQYLDLPSWTTSLMIWALLPWTWWAVRRTMLQLAHPFPALALGYLLVTVGYVYGTILLALVLLACLLDTWVMRDRRAALRVLLIGVVCGLVAVTVYLPGILTIGVTIRDGPVGLPGKFVTDPAGMLTSVLPTAAVPAEYDPLLPYAYAAWLLPALLWVDLARLRRSWRPLSGLLFLTAAVLLIVVGPSEVGPLRWPMRNQPFLVQCLVVLCAVTVSRFGVRRASPARLGASLLWVSVACVIAIFRAPGEWPAHVLSGLLVCAALAVLWHLFTTSRPPRLLAAAAAVSTLAVLGLQHHYFPQPPSPERHTPEHLAGFRTQLPAAEGDIMLVGDHEEELLADPASSRAFVAGTAWYLTDQPVQNTYTTISFREYYDRYCINYIGATCPDALDTLFSVEPVTGEVRADLLSISTLQLTRVDFPEWRLRTTPPGWHVVDSTPWSVTWVRDEPLPSAGGPVWASPGTSVSPVSTSDRTLVLKVEDVPAGGGRVAFSRLAWPGYRTDVGELGEPVDDYLLTLDLPPDAAGRTVTVHFSPPGWTVELVCWWVAVLLSLGWSAVWFRSRRSPRGSIRRRSPGLSTSSVQV